MEWNNSAIDQRTIPFLVSADDVDAERGDTMGIFRREGDDAVLRNVPLGPLRKNLTEVVDALQKVFSDVAEQSGTLPLREAHLSFQVTAGGGIELIGTSLQGTRAMTLVFRQ